MKLLAFILLVFCTSCQNRNDKSTYFYTKVTHLRIREEANQKSKVLATLEKYEKLLFLNQESKTQESIQIGDEKDNRPWYKVKVDKTGVEGWIYGGGVLDATAYEMQLNKDKSKIDTLTGKYKITKATFADFQKAKYSFVDKMVFDTLKYGKKNNTISLPTSKGNIQFRDTIGQYDEDVSTYTYVGQYEKLGFYLVLGSFYEEPYFYLTNKQTGVQTEIWESPSLAPLEDFIANVSCFTPLEIPKGVQIWSINKNQSNKIQKYIEIIQDVWVPKEMFWETEKTIILKVVDAQKFMNIQNADNLKEKDFYYLRVTIE